MKIVLGSSEKPHGKILFIFIFILTTLLFISAAVFTLGRIRPVFEEKAAHAAKIKAIEAINNAAGDVFDEFDTDSLVRINSDDNGNIISVCADSVTMNRLRSKIGLKISEYAEKCDNTYVYIPIGSLTSYPVFQGMGYKIPVKISIDGLAKVDFKDEFTDAGINQVKHKIFLTAETEVYAVSAVMTISEKISAEIPVCETVIVGDVPDYYGSGLNVVGK